LHVEEVVDERLLERLDATAGADAGGRRLRKNTYMLVQIASMPPSTIGYPRGDRSSGMYSKFIP
jgi:hypothetical protein